MELGPQRRDDEGIVGQAERRPSPSPFGGSEAVAAEVFLGAAGRLTDQQERRHHAGVGDSRRA